MKEPRNTYTTPTLIVHGTVEELTTAKMAGDSDLEASSIPPGRALGKVYDYAEDAFQGRSKS